MKVIDARSSNLAGLLFVTLPRDRGMRMLGRLRAVLGWIAPRALERAEVVLEGMYEREAQEGELAEPPGQRD